MFEGLSTLLVTREGPVVRVRLDVPEAGNALSSRLLDELLAVLDALRADPAVRVVVLSGSGPDFCLGWDRQSAAGRGDPAAIIAHTRVDGDKVRRVCEALATSHAVTIARLHGRVAGAGMALAMFCDLRAGADTSRFRLPELALGLPPVWGGALSRFISEVGAARVRELVLTGQDFDAATAVRLSVLHQSLPENGLDHGIESWIRPLIRRSPSALRVTKAALNSYAASARMADASLLEADLLAALAASPDRRPV